MKCKFISAMLTLALLVEARAQTALEFINDVIVNSPPQVDAYSFINNHTLDFFMLTLAPYQTANTTNFVNRGLMQSDSGFRFDTFTGGQHRAASNWLNEATGTINCGVSTNFGFFLLSSASRCLVTADLIENHGVVNLGPESVARFKGNRVDMEAGVVGVQADLTGGAAAQFDGYWGLGNSEGNPAVNYGNFPFTPAHWITNRQYFSFQNLISATAATPYSLDVFAGASNRVVHAVFIQNSNPAISNNVYFSGPNGAVFVEWIWLQTNFLFDTVTTNRLVLQDTFGSRTNHQLARTGTAAPNTGPQPSFTPTNYNFFSGFFGLGSPAPTGFPLRGFNNSNITNEYTAYEAVLSASTVLLGELAGQTYSNLPGRIEIEGKDVNLELARLGAINYVSVQASENFAGAHEARIAAPFAAMDLRKTDAPLIITNVMLPAVPRLEGPVDLYSARWTNVDTLNFTNTYHVLVVDSRLQTAAVPQFTDVKLRSSNVVIHDVLNVLSNFFTEAENLTIATNAAGALNPAGGLNLLNGQVVWPSIAPRLRNFTNDGTLTSFNSAFFRGERRPPYFANSYDEPYDTFVNRGGISDQGSQIWAKHFENSGFLLCGSGSFTLSRNLSSQVLGGAVVAAGDITVHSASLTLSNAGITAGRSLTLAVTNLLADTVRTNGNSWSLGGGFNLLVKPTLGDLLGTTILSSPPATVPPNATILHRWAGEDRGAVKAGFTNNVAIGRLVLDGSNGKRLRFQGAGNDNAIYVDYLELRNYTTNRNAAGDYQGLQIDPNMNIYFAQAVQDGVSIAAKLDGRYGSGGTNGGQLRWVPDYAGFYSSTNIIYPDGSTNEVNAALVASDLDSDCDNLQNSLDTTPVLLVTTAGLPDATNDSAYTVALQAYGGPPAAYSWDLDPESDALPAGLTLSEGGVLFGTPTQAGSFALKVRASVNSPCGAVTAERDLSLTVHPDILTLTLAVVAHAPPGAQVSWKAKPDSTNYVYYRTSMIIGDWELLTNFVSTVGGTVSVWDPVGPNQSRYYRVKVSSPTP